MEYQEKIIVCVDCSHEFTFSIGEQKFFYGKMPPLAEPKRCKECRKRRKLTIRPPEEVRHG